LERRSASAGERRSAQWIAGRLEELGARDVRLRSFDYQHSFGPAQGLHFAAGAVGALVRSRLLPAAALLSFECEYSGRSQWVRALLPSSEGTSVTARLPAAGEAKRTLVLVAHHDAAHTGLMWDPRLLRAGDAAAARTGRRASLALLPEIGFLLACSRRRAARVVAAAILALAAVLAVDVTRGAIVPGANDNATGVAGLLELIARFAADPLPDTDLIAVIPGCEESGMGGMSAWLRDELHRLDPKTTLVLGLDTIGSADPIVLEAEGGAWAVRYRDEDLGRLEAAAARAGLDPPRRWRLGGWTDPVLARLAGLPAISVLSVRDGGFPNYHRPADDPKNVDWGCVERCVALAEVLARDLSRA
jgi:Peptidase family M28